MARKSLSSQAAIKGRATMAAARKRQAARKADKATGVQRALTNPGASKRSATATARLSSKAKPNPKAPLGQGGRFAAVAAEARKSGARNPNAVAASAGIKKYGAKRMAAMAAAGRKRRS